MTWRNSNNAKDRFFATLPYLLPLISVLPFGMPLMLKFPILSFIYIPLTPLININNSVNNLPLGGMIIFFILFFAVVRNYNISHFIRFNTMQAILIDILVVLFSLCMGVFIKILPDLLLETLLNVIFLATLASCLYAIVKSALGQYAEIPTISEAANSQII